MTTAQRTRRPATAEDLTVDAVLYKGNGSTAYQVYEAGYTEGYGHWARVRKVGTTSTNGTMARLRNFTVAVEA